MRNKLLACSAVAISIVATACGGASKGASPSTSPTGPTTTVHVAKAAADTPSVSAKMVCEKEAVDDIYNTATGVKTVKTPAYTWDKATHVLTCDYLYPGGAQMTLSVKEMSSAEETTTYFEKLQTELGKGQELQGLGQGAFQTKNGSMVVRKDFKVLLIDVGKLPASFGVPADPRGNVAINVAETIMGCWTGA